MYNNSKGAGNGKTMFESREGWKKIILGKITKI